MYIKTEIDTLLRHKHQHTYTSDQSRACDDFAGLLPFQLRADTMSLEIVALITETSISEQSFGVLLVLARSASQKSCNSRNLRCCQKSSTICTDSVDNNMDTSRHNAPSCVTFGLTDLSIYTKIQANTTSTIAYVCAQRCMPISQTCLCMRPQSKPRYATSSLLYSALVPN